MLIDEIKATLDKIHAMGYPQDHHGLMDLYFDFELYDDFIYGMASSLIAGIYYPETNLNYQSDLSSKLEEFKPSNEKVAERLTSMIEYKKKLDKLLILIKKAYSEHYRM
jgi:hypothetical protein